MNRPSDNRFHASYDTKMGKAGFYYDSELGFMSMWKVNKGKWSEAGRFRWSAYDTWVQYPVVNNSQLVTDFEEYIGSLQCSGYEPVCNEEPTVSECTHSLLSTVLKLYGMINRHGTDYLRTRSWFLYNEELQRNLLKAITTGKGYLVDVGDGYDNFSEHLESLLL